MNKKEQGTLISTYEKEIQEWGSEKKEACLEEAKAYNAVLAELQGIQLGNEEVDSEQGYLYEEQLNLTGTGMMGNLEIPKIDLQLPIYHGTSDDVLAAGVGHLQGTSLPVGGDYCRAVLTGHCGLPSAELFTRLDEMENGDYFFVRVCGELLGYKVVEIEVVEPEDENAILPEKGRDLISLVTCTPYGINTHRLIVTGERVKETNVESLFLKETERGIDEKIYCVAAVSVILLIYLVRRSGRGKCKNSSVSRAGS